MNWCGELPFTSSSSGQTVVTEKRGPVLTVGINRPDVCNAVNQETSRRLFEEFSAFNQDDTLNVAVLHGIGQCCSLEIAYLIKRMMILTIKVTIIVYTCALGFFFLIKAWQTNIMIVFFFCLYSHLLSFCAFLFFFFCILRDVFSGGNFCAGYDLKELSQDYASLTLEQNVTRGPAPMVRGGPCSFSNERSIYITTLNGITGSLH